MEITRQQLEDRTINYVHVFIGTEKGCNPKDGEYDLTLCSFIGGLNLSAPGGVDDISLIKEAIVNELDFTKLPEEGGADIILKESGEWEDVFWHKYYVIDRVNFYSA